MKKKWFFLLTLAVMATSSPAGAVTLLSDGFDTSAAPAFSTNWGVVDVSGTDGNWITSTASIHPAGISPHSAPNMAVFNSYSTQSGQTRLYQTSGIDLSSQSNATVSLWMYHDIIYPNSDTVQVQVSTDAGGTWTDAGAPIARYDGTTQWTQHTINIDAYTGGGMTDVRIGFLGISTYGNDIHIDDIAVSSDDITAPTGHIEVYSYYGEVSGNQVGIAVSTEDNDSLVKDVCLWLGDDENNLIQPAICKTLAEKDWNSYDYAPSFSFSWDSTTIADGTYNLYVIATDNANNVGKLGPVAMTINNSSLGSPSQPAPITTCQEFQNIINHGGWYYEIKNDIDCAETKNWNGGKGFLSIGFGGVLNGYNYNISDLYMNTDYIGIFGQIDSGGRISGVNFRKVQLIGHTTYGGGFSAYNSGTIEKSSITGSMQLSNGNQCGGFAIQNSGTISQSWGDMTIGTSGYLGGIAGHGVGGKIENCYFKGELQSLGYAGGLVGINEGQFSSSGIINNSYSTAKVSGGSSNGGMIGWQYQQSTQSGSYWDTETSGFDIMCGSDALGGANCDDTHGLTDAQMKLQASFVAWDFDNIWRIDPDKNDGYPYLAWQTSFTQKQTLTISKTGTGKGTVTSTPTGINCGTDCSETYALDTVVTLAADPADNSVFIGWSGGDCTGTGVCTVTMDDQKYISASFKKKFPWPMFLPAITKGRH
ncbi:MAG: hypothetical protein Q7U64_13945 [Desulfocapsaceae bacterium]|nr:hypothetical protein [Desulfocapsaceae bacterium]